jgi:hypothetical protein
VDNPSLRLSVALLPISGVVQIHLPRTFLSNNFSHYLSLFCFASSGEVSVKVSFFDVPNTAAGTPLRHNHLRVLIPSLLRRSFLHVRAALIWNSSKANLLGRLMMLQVIDQVISRRVLGDVCGEEVIDGLARDTRSRVARQRVRRGSIRHRSGAVKSRQATRAACEGGPRGKTGPD